MAWQRDLAQRAALGAGRADVRGLSMPMNHCARGAEDDRRLVAPAMRIAVAEGLVLAAARPFSSSVSRIGFSASRTPRPAKCGTFDLKRPGVVHRLVERQVVLHADLEVLDAVRGRGVHEARAGFQRHVLGEHDRHHAIVERMAASGGPRASTPLARPAIAFAVEAVALRARLRAGRRRGSARRASVSTSSYSMSACDGDGLVAGQRPRRGGPDHRERGFAGSPERRTPRRARSRSTDREGHVDRGRGAVLVLDLGFGERRAAVDAPVHGLQAPVEQAVLPDAAERADLARPRSRSPSSGRDGPSRPARPGAGSRPSGARSARRRTRGRARAACWARGCGRASSRSVLDRQAVAVPAGHVGRVEARHRLGLDHDVLQDLVDRVADVDVAVGVGRAVVQDELRAALAAASRMRS